MGVYDAKSCSVAGQDSVQANANRTTQVQLAMMRLDSSVTGCHKRLSDLIDRIKPVLANRPTPDRITENNGASPPNTDLALAIETKVQQLEEMEAILASALDRCEL